MAKKRQKFFWHVPPNGWFSGSPGAPDDNTNVGGDIVVPLVDTETVLSARPDMDNFVVERVVGQFQMHIDEDPAVKHYVHHRVYVAQGDATSVAIRDLKQEDDAETSFLFHRVQPWHQNWDADDFGDWQDGAAGVPAHQGWMGRHGNFDIKVGRRLEGGDVLIWHVELVPAPIANDEAALRLWVRILVRQG